MSNFSYLNPDNFKKWMKNQGEFEGSIERDLIGLQVETKFSAKRIMSKITVDTGKPGKVSRDFAENGGKILDVIDDEYLVEVKSGSFLINKNLVIF